MTTMTKSKRRSERIRVSLPVSWIKRSGVVETSAADINLHGMFLKATDLSVLPGQMLQLQVSLPDTVLEMFVFTRFVGRTESGVGMGVEIFVMDEAQRATWSNFYRAQLARQRKTARVAIAAAR